MLVAHGVLNEGEVRYRREVLRDVEKRDERQQAPKGCAATKSRPESSEQIHVRKRRLRWGRLGVKSRLESGLIRGTGSCKQ
jgi:hypothetical protein